MLEENLILEKDLLQTSFSCSNPACKKSVLVSDPYSPEAAVLNASTVCARLAGCGLHAMEVTTAYIGMVSPFTHAMCTKHKNISIKACEVAKNSCVAAAEHLHIVMGKPLDEVLDVVTVMGHGKNVDALLLLVLLWLLLGNWTSIGVEGSF